MYHLKYEGSGKTVILWVYNDGIIKWWATIDITGTRSFPKEDQPLVMELIYTLYKVETDLMMKEVCFNAIKDLTYNRGYIKGYY